MSETPVDGWETAKLAFPKNGAPADKLRFLLRYALLAPSSRNTQPWLFKIIEDTIELYADRRRGQPVIDPADREMVIACGAALMYLRIAIRHFGYADEVDLFPDLWEPDLLARVRLGVPRKAALEDKLLFEAIPKRHTNRDLFQDLKVPAWLLNKLQATAREEQTKLQIVTDADQRYPIADLIAEADHMQWADQEYRSELAEWVHPNQSHDRDGLPGYALGMADKESDIAPLLMETFDLSSAVAKKDYRQALAAPVLAVLLADSDSPADWLCTGQALAKLLLRASAENVSAAFFNQPIEIPGMRGMLAEILGEKGFPQLMFRLGYGPNVKPTPRRPVREVLLSAED
jgi:hypothetical protein